MSVRTLRKWKARRSGAALTVEGIDAATDRIVRIANIPLLAPEDGKLIILDRFGGQRWELSMDDRPRAVTEIAA